MRDLTYCLNVHPAESWPESLAAIKLYALAVRNQLDRKDPFGLGLRLSSRATLELLEEQRLAEFQQFLADENLYVFTVNGFPYAQFHDTAVKADVYLPDWRSAERIEYTCRLADVMAGLGRGSGGAGSLSISSVPGCYVGNGQPMNSDYNLIMDNLGKTVRYLAELEERTGQQVTLALEPEPDCLFDSVVSTIRFFDDFGSSRAVDGLAYDWRRYLGVCFDACHFAVVFDDPTASLRRLLAHGLAVPKLQISAALRAQSGPKASQGLKAFAEATYLHQTRLRLPDGAVQQWPDLTADALDTVAAETEAEVRVHMHVPLYFESSGVLESTADLLDAEFFAAAAEIDHWEIETYTFGVLPPALASLPIVASIVREFEFVQAY